MPMKNILTAAMLTMLYIGLLIGSLPACGKKGDPLPPESLVPERIGGFMAQGRSEALLLSWTIPKKNNDGSDLDDLAGFKLYQKKSGEGCNNCPSEFPSLGFSHFQQPVLDIDILKGQRDAFGYS